MSAIQTVVDNNMCVGCGGCRVVAGNAIEMRRNELGYFGAILKENDPESLNRADEVCPFSDSSLDEDALAQQLFSDKGFKFDSRIGFYSSLYAGRLCDDDVLPRHSSGGLTTWLLAELIASGEVDGVIHVGEIGTTTGDLVGYLVSESVDEVLGRTKSRYYSVSFDSALEQVRGNGRRYAFVGVPCFVKAIRLLCNNDEVVRKQIAYSFALVCGHMKSAAFAELLAWQVGVEPARLDRFDFRVKNRAAGASNYSIEAVSKEGEVFHGSTRLLYGTNWGYAFFQLGACDFCDDVLGELADASFGDAWLPRYESNWRGTNVVVCRNLKIQDLLTRGHVQGLVSVDPLTEDDVVASQEGNFRHRWDGLSLRLSDFEKLKKWAPKKRIKAGSRKVPFIRKAIIRLRYRLARESHGAFFKAKQGRDLNLFFNEMLPLTRKMESYYRILRLIRYDYWVGRVSRFIKLG